MNKEPNPAESQSRTEDAPTLTFHMQKGNLFRVVYCDGVWVSSSTTGGVEFLFYTERPPIPQQVTYSISGGGLGEEIKQKRVIKDGMVREIEVGVILPELVLETMYYWLKDRFDKTETAPSNEP